MFCAAFLNKVLASSGLRLWGLRVWDLLLQHFNPQPFASTALPNYIEPESLAQSRTQNVGTWNEN